MKNIYLIIVVGLFSIAVNAQTQLFDDLLHKHVSAKGWVDYKGLKGDETQLDKYLDFLNQQNPKSLSSKTEKKAMWINAYNAFTLKLILNHYPLKSITNIDIEGKKAWDVPFVKVGGKMYTLNHIEHEILRKKFSDPRIHVGVNCASVSCPAIPNHAFSAKNIEHLLNKGMSAFVNDVTRNTITPNKAELSQIFNWFKNDFTTNGSLITFINKYSRVKLNKNAVITYKDYNWNLNQQ